MGRYLELAREALAELKAAPTPEPPEPPTPHHGATSADATPEYDINDQNDKRVAALPLWADPDNPDVQAAWSEAARLGALGKSACELNAAVGTGSCQCRWIDGDALAGLPEGVQGLVCPRDGWTPDSWAAYLRLRADRGDDRHDDLAERYRQAARLLGDVA